MIVTEGGSDSKAGTLPPLPRGTYAKVARIHRVSRQFVRMVDRGEKRSATVEATLQRYRAKQQLGEETAA